VLCYAESFWSPRKAILWPALGRIKAASRSPERPQSPTRTVYVNLTPPADDGKHRRVAQKHNL
jgi:hypothetical protein